MPYGGELTDFTQYGLAAAVTFLLLKEIFAFIVKMRERANTTSTVTTNTMSTCSFTAHQDAIISNLQDIRDGIRDLVELSKRKR